MSNYKPTFILYETDGLTPVYTFSTVENANYPNDDIEIIEHRNYRADGAIYITGGSKPWDLTINGVLINTEYKELIDDMDALLSAVALNTFYILKIGKDTGSEYSYNVKRILPIKFPIDSKNKRTTLQRYEITFKVLSEN